MFVQVATLDELPNLRRLVPRLLELPLPVEVLVVDDDSADGTPEWLAVRQAEWPALHTLVRVGRRGYASATIEGFRRALELGAERIVTMDADLSHDPEAVPALVAAADEADLVIGSRYRGGCRVLDWPLRRLFLSVGANLYVRRLLRLPVDDATSGFRCYRAAALRELGDLDLLSSGGYAVLVELLYRLSRRGARVHEHPIVFRERRIGRSKMSLGMMLEGVFVPWRLLLRVGLRRRSPARRADPAAS